MRFKKKKMMITFILMIIIITVGIIRFNKSNIINKFINYNYNENLYTRFDLTVNLDNEIITNITTDEKHSKDRIKLLNQLNNLDETDFIEFNRQSNADIFVIISNDKILNKDKYNHYFANLNIYLDENIICLSIYTEMHDESSIIEKKYYKMDNNTNELAKKIINNAINQQA